MRPEWHERFVWNLFFISLLALSSLMSINATPSSAQDQGQVVRLSARLITVPVSLSDASGQPVLNLKAEDFLLQEDGQPQQILSLDEAGETPIELALLLDASGSTRARFQFQQQAAARFLKTVLKPHDAVSVFSIGQAPTLVQARTTNINQAIRGLLTIEPSRQPTAFFDSIAEAAQALGGTAAPGRRRVLVALSDGDDNYSTEHEFRDALRALQQADCLFYAINPGGSSIRLNVLSLKGQGVMKGLASQTGGAVFLPARVQDLETVFTQIAAELQAQYLLGYYSTNRSVDGRFRRIAVRVPNRPQLRLRARQGYYASRH